MALCGYLMIKDHSGNQIEGECTTAGHEKWVKIWGGSHSVKLPTTENGLPNGKRIHFPLQIFKEVDRTSPIFYQYLSSGEILSEVIIDWHRINPETSKAEAYFRQTLNNVQINAAQFHMKQQAADPWNSNPEHNMGHMECVQLIYDQITWTMLEGGIEYDDSQSGKSEPSPKKEATHRKPKEPLKKHFVQWEVEIEDKLPVPDDYLATLLVYGTTSDRILSKRKQDLTREAESRVFKLKTDDEFEAYLIEPHKQFVLDDLKANNHIKQSVNEGHIEALSIRGTDDVPDGSTVHYAPAKIQIERQIQITADISENKKLTFELRSSNTLTQDTESCRNTENPNQPPLLEYNQLSGTEEFALYGFEDDLPAVEIVPPIPLKDWMDKDKLLEHGIGSKGGPQLKEYQLINGHIPKLTFMASPPQFGLFFDGTGNNKTNDNKELDDDREPTNIAKLSELYDTEGKNSWSYYSEGIGTDSDAWFDNPADLGTAYSLDERINIALKEMRTFFERFRNAKVGFIDIFGFSRGATQARIMVNVIHYLNANEPDYWGGIKLMVRFVGVYDTVGSVGMGGDNDNEWYPATGELPGAPNPTLKGLVEYGPFYFKILEPLLGPHKTATLDIAPNAACAVYHLGALDEERENFPISSIRSGKNASLPEHYIEEDVPGAHADVGGGYANGETIIGYPSKTLSTMLTSSQIEDEKQKLKRELEQKYYRPGIKIEIKQTMEQGGNYAPPKIKLSPFWKRNVRKDLSLIYLEAMYKKAVEYGVPFKKLKILAELTYTNEDEEKVANQADSRALYDGIQASDDLKQLYADAVAQGVNSSPYNELSEHYIHHSHKFVGLQDSLANPPEKNPIHSYGNYGREVFYAGDKGLSDNGEWELKTNNKGAVQWYKKDA